MSTRSSFALKLLILPLCFVIITHVKAQSFDYRSQWNQRNLERGMLAMSEAMRTWVELGNNYPRQAQTPPYPPMRPNSGSPYPSPYDRYPGYPLDENYLWQPDPLLTNPQDQTFSHLRPFSGQNSTQIEALDGAWLGNNDALFIIQAGYYRLYLTQEHFQDGQLKIGYDQLQLLDQTGQTLAHYEMALDQNRMALRNQNGHLLLFKKVR